MSKKKNPALRLPPEQLEPLKAFLKAIDIDAEADGVAAIPNELAGDPAAIVAYQQSMALARAFISAAVKAGEKHPEVCYLVGGAGVFFNAWVEQIAEITQKNEKETNEAKGAGATLNKRRT
jgi:hypothetical protein